MSPGSRSAPTTTSPSPAARARRPREGDPSSLRASPRDNRIELDDVVVDIEGREVTVGDESVELTAKEFDLLAYFLESPGVVHSRDRLLDRVWGMSYPGGTRTVDVHVGQLRRKLGRPTLIRDRPRGRVQGRRAVSAAAVSAAPQTSVLRDRRHRRGLDRRDVRHRRRAVAAPSNERTSTTSPTRLTSSRSGRTSPTCCFLLTARAAAALPRQAEPADQDRRP